APVLEPVTPGPTQSVTVINGSSPSSAPAAQRQYVQLNELHPSVPEVRQGWSDEEYAGRIEINLGRAGSLQLEADEAGTVPDEGALQEPLVEALVLAIEWANRRHWPLAQDFGLRLDWRTHGFFYLILRASEGISGAHW